LKGSNEYMKKLFGSSGIRGIVGKELDSEFFLRIGKAVGTTLSLGAEVCIATDTRTSRDLVRNAFCEGLLSTGVNITNLGILPTPALAKLTNTMNFDTGVMVTASHNPPEYNGIKLFNGDTIGYDTEQERHIEEVFFSDKYRCGTGSIKEGKGAYQNYFQQIKEHLGDRTILYKPKIVVDPGNGAASIFASKILRQMGYEVVSLNDVQDGRFPGRNPEPKADTLGDTIRIVNEEDAEIAICFDGDADRVVFCDREGFLGFDEMALFVSLLRMKETGKTTIATTVESGRLFELVHGENKGKIMRGKVGDVNVAHLSKQLDAALGVESIGVFIYPELGYYPDSIFTALYLLRNLTKPGQLREYYSNLPKLYSQKVKIPCNNQMKTNIMKSLENLSIEQLQKLGEQPSKNTIDGLRIEFNDSWILIRPSGTEPVIRIIVESDTISRASVLINSAQDIVQRIINSY